jgi:hypothetical protein
MENYLDVANSKFLAIMGGFVFVFILSQSALFLRKAWNRGLEIGIDRAKLKAAIRQSMVFSIIPSLPILLSLIAMAPVLGIYFPWIRLSIIGSATYELIAADIGAKSMGITGLGGDGYTAAVFANSMWIMSLGIVWGLVLILFFLNRIQNKISKAKSRDAGWVQVMIAALFAGMISVFLGDTLAFSLLQLLPGSEGAIGYGLPVLLTSCGTMLFFGWLINRFKINWLKDFAMSFSMIIAMASAVLISL